MSGTCAIEGCDAVIHVRGWCQRHYRRFLRTGHAGDEGLRYPSSRPGHTPQETAEKVGISYRQLDYWARCDYVRPTLEDAEGSGTRRRYSDNDLLKVQCLADLRRAGVELATATDLLRQIEAEDIDFERVLFVVSNGSIEPQERVA